MKNSTVSAVIRNRSLIALVIIAVLMALLAGCGGQVEAPITVPASAQAGDLVGLEPCTYEAGDVEYAADCGTLVVPENRNTPDSRLIALPVIRINATGNNPTEPIFWLTGGPGASNIYLNPPPEAIEDHDMVMVGYRGVDGSVVADALVRHGHPSVVFEPSLREIAKRLHRMIQPGDIVLTLGAGDVWKVGEELVRSASRGGGQRFGKKRSA